MSRQKNGITDTKLITRLELVDVLKIEYLLTL
jgi:hypothetical protein